MLKQAVAEQFPVLQQAFPEYEFSTTFGVHAQN
jgi:hypothetical protein